MGRRLEIEYLPALLQEPQLGIGNPPRGLASKACGFTRPGIGFVRYGVSVAKAALDKHLSSHRLVR